MKDKNPALDSERLSQVKSCSYPVLGKSTGLGIRRYGGTPRLCPLLNLPTLGGSVFLLKIYKMEAITYQIFSED